MQLGRHLLKDENEHVEVHEVCGFMAETVLRAMKEAQAVAQGPRMSDRLSRIRQVYRALTSDIPTVIVALGLTVLNILQHFTDHTSGSNGDW